MKSCLKLFSIAIIYTLKALSADAQTATITGSILADGKPVELASILLHPTNMGALSDASGNFFIQNIPAGNYQLRISCVGYNDYAKTILLKSGDHLSFTVPLVSNKATLSEVVVTGVSKTTLIRENPVAIVSVATKKIEQTNESNIIDVLVKNVPGLHAVKTGPNISRPLITSAFSML